MLIPLNGPVLVEYSKKATQKNKKGYDDGTPYTFWLERSIKKIRKETGDESLIDLYKSVRREINTTTVDDINANKERFDDTFLAFCQNKIHKEKYKGQDDKLPNSKKLLKDYINREKLIKKLYSIRWLSGLIGLLGFGFSAITFFAKWNKEITIPYKGWYLIVALLLVIIFIVCQIKKPRAFCTFEKIDTEKILDKINAV